MFVTKPKQFTLTLVVYIALVLTLATTSDGKSYAAINVNRRDHGSLKRLIKMRSPFPQGPVIGAGAAPPPPVTPPAGSSTRLVTSSVSSDTSQVSSGTPLSTPVSLSSSSSAVSSSSDSSTSASSSSESSVATTSPASTSSTASEASQTSEVLNVSGLTEDTAINTGPATVTRTSVAVASASASAEAVKAAAKTKSTTLTVLIIVASCIGGVAILWTVFRKWKLGRSAKFDARLQPIDWQPTNPDEGIIPEHRRVNSDTSSFHSGTGHGDMSGHGVGGYGATSDLGHGHSDYGHGASTLAPLPDHDFTAGSSSLAPVGGYADLARGPSPQPQMQEALTRGPSVTRPNYDLGVPLHHQAGYGTQDAYDYRGAMRY